MRLWKTSSAVARAGSSVAVHFPDGDDSPWMQERGEWEVPAGYWMRPYIPRDRSNARRVQAALSQHPVATWDLLSPQARQVAASIDADVVIAEQVSAWPLVRFVDSRIPRVLVAQNIEADVVRRMAPLMQTRRQRARYRWEALKLSRLERSAFSEADVVFAMSQRDRQTILDLCPGSRVELSPNGVSCGEFSNLSVRGRSQNKLLLTGSFDYPPNEDAALWIHDQILPRIRDVLPLVTVDIVGRGASSRLRAMHDPRCGFNVVGEVEDVRPYLAESTIFLMPIRVGGGTRLKALEAMAAGIPIVSTTAGLEGIELGDPPAAIVADSTADLVAACIRLCGDPAEVSSLRQSGRLLVEKKFAWEVVNQRLIEVIAELGERRRDS